MGRQPVVTRRRPDRIWLSQRATPPSTAAAPAMLRCNVARRVTVPSRRLVVAVPSPSPPQTRTSLFAAQSRPFRPDTQLGARGLDGGGNRGVDRGLRLSCPSLVGHRQKRSVGEGSPPPAAFFALVAWEQGGGHPQSPAAAAQNHAGSRAQDRPPAGPVRMAGSHRPRPHAGGRAAVDHHP